MSELDDFSAPLTPAASARPTNPLDAFSAPSSSAQQKAVVNANAIPDEAGRALSISKETGIPASIVQTDLPGYDAHTKSQAAIKAVQNPAIANYVNNNPMASQVSNDDYKQLDEVSQYFLNLHEDAIHAKATVGVNSGIAEVASLMQSAPGRERLFNALKELPGALGEGILGFFKTPGDVASGKIDLTTPEGLSQGIGFGLGVALGGRDVQVGRVADVGPQVRVSSTEDFLAKVRGMKTRAEIDEFLQSKTDKPHAELLQIEKATVAGEALDKAVEVSQESKTKQRSPDLYEEFLQSHGDQGTVHIPAQAILDLYQKEGKVPMIGDGLFGFVPGLADKATLAAETGAEIKIPLSKYVAHVDEAVHAKLVDQIRVQEKGVTREEAKELAKTEEPQLPPVAEGDIRFYHGTAFDDASEFSGQTFVTPHYDYAKNYRGDNNNVLYTDFSKAEAIKRGLYDEINNFPRHGSIDDGASLLKPTEPRPKSLSSQPVPTESIAQAAVENVVRERKSLYLEPLFTSGEDIGITQPEFKRYSDLIDRSQEHILTKAVTLAKREVSKRQTPEWHANEEALRKEVEKEIYNSPAFAADRYFNTDKGLLPNGKRVIHTHFTSMDLSQSDAFAPIFGFESGSALVKAVLELEGERTDLGKGPKFQFKQHVDAETARRMEAKYGNLADNIALEASEAALADWNVDLLATEWRMLAKLNGRDPPLSREQLKDWATAQFDKSVASEVSYEQWRRAAEKGGREAEKALLKKNYEEAFIAKQRQMLAFLLAKEAKAFEKESARTDKKIGRFTSEQVIPSMDQAHLEQIRDILASIGVEQKFAPTMPLEPIQQFVADSEGQISVAPWLRGEVPQGQRMPSIEDMSVEQFRDLAKSLQSMEHVAKQVKTLSNAREAADLQNVIFDVKKELDRFNFIDQPMNPTLGQRASSLARKVTGTHLLVERMFDYTDRFDPHGPITSFLDRPLRDSNVKELVLTEQVTKMLRDLQQHTDAAVNDPIENNLIPDKNDKTGFANMRRFNLRQLMLNTGNWSNLKKTTEGFGINETDLRRFIDKNATKADVAWVNGVWDIFAHLKPEADAMQLRDTGVPVDTIPAVAWDVAAGQLKGGYYPIVYDRYNSDIQGHMAAKNPVFDPNYVQATTPHGYTQTRTEFKGALDLTGGFLASRIQGMIHDIAFREAVRNANKLISNQEFRTAIAQKWGKEYSDLLPSWLKDIANSHTLDDNYAQGITRGMALVRQNVISTLIAYNPGTFIKHGFTAAVMSATQVGAGALGKATAEIGVKGAAATAKDLISRNDRVPDEAFMNAFRTVLDTGERGENARQFVLDSSAVMRNRQRQADDSVRGAVDRMNNYGWGQSFSNFRDRQMLLGRFMVAFSDGMSSYPTWLAAYKKAYMAGEDHADAVFIADKEVSRAHGSSFVGDQPLVTRIKNGPTGELARWFVPLYKFWNHTVNNNFQLTWDTAAALRDTPDGTAPEPGANAWSISKRVGLILATIFIEEQASAAKDEDHHGLLTKMALASLRYFGAGFVGARELTNGLAAGYEPSTGLIGTISKGINETVKDLKQATGIKAGIAKNWIIHTATTLGYATGIGGTQLGKTGSFLNDLRTGREQPRTFNDYRQGLRTGHSKARVH